MEKYHDLTEALNGIGYDFANQKKNTKEYLYKINNYKKRVFKSIEASKININNNYFSISSVSKEINCSRTTIYSSNILKDYISSINEELKLINPYIKIQSLEEEINILKKKVENMKARDVELELLRLENIELKDKLGHSKKGNVYDINI